ncbi:MAG: hypothetical protein N3B18_10865, partial [Desulfobacterota bacterium]|nr:hypothetical protein [Thermodesulfobacteriota bacterium]
ELKGRDVYIITTSGGPMERKNEAIAAYAREKGLRVKGVFNISRVMKKTQEEIDRDVAAVLKTIPLQPAAAATP